jgi:hypothetical protein
MLPINEKLSKYAEKLPVPARTHFLAKLEVIGGVDPWDFKDP